MKKIIIATVVLFVVWQIMDFLIHGVLLQSAYVATAQYWRPMAEMKQGLLMLVCLIHAFAVSWIYAKMVTPKSMKTALQYGVILGVAFGVGMGHGMYAVMPLPYSLTLSWFLANVAELTVGGLLLGLLIKE